MKNYQILIGTADHSLSKLLKSVLKSSPFDINETVTKSEEIIPALSRFSADLAIIDTTLLPGAALEKTIRTIRSERSIPVLLLAPAQTPRPAFMKDDSGLFEILEKPVSPEHLIRISLRLVQNQAKTEKKQRTGEIDQLLRLFIDDSDQGLLIWQKDRLRFSNRQAQRLFRGDAVAPDRIGIDWLLKNLPIGDQQKVKLFLDLPLVNPGPASVLTLYRQGGGLPSAWLEVRAKTIDFDSEPALKLTVNDISDRTDLEERRASCEQTFHTLAESGTLFIFQLDLRGHLLYFSPSLQKLLRLPKRKRPPLFQSLVDHVQRAEADAILARAREGIASEPREIRFPGPGKEPVILEIEVLPVRQKGSLTGLMAIARDVTRRHRQEVFQSESELKWQLLVQNAPERISLVDREGTILYRNRSILPDLFEEEQENSLFDFVNAEGAKKISDSLDRVFEAGINARFECHLTPPRGGRRWLENSLTPIFHDDIVTNALCITQDITDRKRTEEALRLSERLNRATIDALSDPIYVVDETLSITLYNRSFAKWCESLHLDTTAVGKNIFNIFPFFSKKNRDEYKQVLKTGKALVTEDKITLSGAKYYTETVKVPIMIGDRIEQVLTILHDLTSFRKAEEALQDSMRRYELAVEASGQIAFEFDPTNERIIWGKSVEKILGYPLGEVDGSIRQWIDWLHPEDRRRAVHHLADSSLKDPFRSAEFRMRHRNGTYIWIRSRGFFLQHNPDQPLNFLGMMEDMSRQKEIEANLNRSEEAYRMLFHQNVVGNMIIVDGKVAMCNDAFCSLHRMSMEDITGKPILELVHPDDWPWGKERIERLITGEIVQESQIYRAKRGPESYFLAEVRSKCIQWQGKPAVQSVIRDITEQKQAENALRESEERYRTLVERVIDGVYRATPEGRFIEVNPAMVTLLGYDNREELLQLDIPSRLYFDPEERRRLLMEQSGSESKIMEVRLRRKDGSPIWVEDHCLHVRDESGAIILHEGIIRDISERKKAEAQLREQYRFIETLLDTIPNPVYYKNLDEVYLGCNKEFERFFGVTREELIGRTMGGFGVPDLIDSRSLADSRADPVSEREVCEGSVTDRRGESRKVLFTKAPFSDANGKRIGQIGIIVDISDRVQMEEKIRRERDRAQTYLDIANVSIVAINRDGTVILINKQGCELLGYPETEIIGKNWFDHFIPPGPREEIRKVFSRIIGNEIDPYTYHENAILNSRGEERLVAWNNTVVRDADGRIIASLSSGQDITERNRAEEKIRASLKEKEVLLREIHHRVKNNLQVISSLLKLQAGLIRDPSIQKLFQDSRDRIRSISLVHEKLYRSSDLTNIDFRDYVKSLVTEMIRTYKDQVTGIHLDLQVDDIHIGVDAAIPCGLIINELISNSLKHAFPEPAWEKGKKQISIHITAPENSDRINFLIGDNGIGLPASIDIESTESLGLHLVRILATDQLGGRMEFERENGTLFRLDFPLEAS